MVKHRFLDSAHL